MHGSAFRLWSLWCQLFHYQRRRLVSRPWRTVRRYTRFTENCSTFVPETRNMSFFECRQPRDSKNGYFLVEQSLAHYSTYSNIHPPAHTAQQFLCIWCLWWCSWGCVCGVGVHGWAVCVCVCCAAAKTHRERSMLKRSRRLRNPRCGH